MAFDASFREQMESFIPRICHERTTLTALLQHAVADLSHSTLRLIFYSPRIRIVTSAGAAVKVRGFTYGFIEGLSPDWRAVAAACSAMLAQIEAIWYEAFWDSHHLHYRKLLAAQERTVLTLLHFRWKRQAIADHLGLSKRTVDTYCCNIFDKLNVRDKTEAIYAGKELGLFLHLPKNKKPTSCA